MARTRNLQDPPRRFRDEPTTARGLKRAVNVSIDTAILDLAKEMNINLSKALEDALRRATEDERARRFYLEHKSSFDAYKAHAKKYGTLAEAFEREFGE